MEPGSEVPIEQIRSVAGETENNPEYTRDDVLGSFRRLSDGLKDSVSTRLTEGMEPQTAPDEEIWGYLITEAARQKANDAGTEGTYTNTFPRENGSQYQQKEGIPVEHLLAYAARQLDREDLTPEQKQELAKDALTLWDNSATYLDYPQRRYDLQKIIARTKQEADFIDTDTRNAGSQDENWYKAENSLIGTSINNIQDSRERSRVKRHQRSHTLLFQRRELIVPSAENTDSTTENIGLNPPTLNETPIIEQQNYQQSDFLDQVDNPQREYRQTDFLNQIDNTTSSDQQESASATQESNSIGQDQQPTEAQNTEDQVEGQAQSPSAEQPTVQEAGNTEDRQEVEQPTEESVDPRFEAMVVNRRTDSEKAAREFAEARWNEMMRDASEIRSKLDRVNPRKLWNRFKLRSLEEFHKQRLMQEYREAAVSNNSSLLDSNFAINAALRHQEQAEANATITGIRAQNEDGSMREGTSVSQIDGELKTQFNENVLRPLLTDTNSYTLEERIANVQNALRTFVEAHQENATVQEFFGRNATEFNVVANYFATDILQMIDAVKANQETHQKVLADMDTYINLQFAKTEWRAQTALEFNAADRVIRKLQGTRAGYLLTPATVGFAFSLGTAALTKGRSVAAHTIGTPLAGALAGATFAAIRRNKDLKVDFQTNAREKTYGGVNQDGSERREKLDTYLHSMASTQSLLEGGQTGRNRTEEDYRGIRELMDLDLTNETHRNALLSRAAEIEERLDFSVRQKVDLISYASEGDVQQGRLDLQLAIIQAKQRLREAGMDTDEVNDEIRKFRGKWNKKFTIDRNLQDQEFTNYRVNQALKAGALGGALGAAAGFIGGQITENIDRIPGSGVVGEKIDATYDKAFETVDKTVDTTTTFDKSTLQDIYNTPEPQTLNLSESVTIQVNPDHTVLLTEGDSIFKGELSADGTITGTGNLPQGAEQEFQSLFEIDKTKVTTDESPITTEQLKQLSESGKGTLPLNEQYQLSYDAQNGTSLINTETNTPVFSSENITISPEGKVQIAGDIPEDVAKLFEDLNFSVNNIDAVNSSVEHTIFGPDVKMVEAAMGTGSDAPLTQIPEGTVWIDGKDGAHTLIVADRPDVVLIPDAKIVNGELTWDKNYSYPEYDPRIGERVDGLFTQMDITNIEVEGSGHWEETPTQGPEGRFEYLKKDTHYSFRTNGTPEFDGSELDMRNDHPADNPDSMILRAEPNNLSYDANGLNPVDVTQAAAEGKTAWGFVMNPGQEGEYTVLVKGGLELPLDPNADPSQLVYKPDGTPHLSPDGNPMTLAEFSKMVLNEEKVHSLPTGELNTEWARLHEGKDWHTAFNVDLINFGLADTNPDGSLNFQQIQAIYGGGGMGTEKIWVDQSLSVPTVTFDTPLVEKLPVAEITIPTSDLTEQFVLTPLEITDTTETVNNGFTFPVTPFLPRYPLEPLATKRMRYYLYNSVPTADRLRLFERNRSQALRENPRAELDPYTEAEQYFTRQNPEYFQEMESLAAQINEPPSENLKAIVCIPVAGHQEGENIYTSLENYLPQTANKDQFEILLFVNYPDKDRNGNPLNADTTLEAIARFKREHPELPVRVMVKSFPPQTVNIGTIRKYLNDTALLRHHNRGEGKGDIILISNDADNKGVAPEYIQNFITKFDNNPNVDGMLGELDWDPEAYAEYPLVHIGTRLFQYLNMIGRNRSGNMSSSGANFAFRGSIYSGIGGYLPDIEGGEDIAIGQAIISARGETNRIQFAGARASRLYTSARRAIKAVEDGIPPVDQWRQGFSAFDDEVRSMQLGNSPDINYDDPNQVARLKEGLEAVINATIDLYEEGEKLGKDNVGFYGTALRYLGVRYHVENDRILIDNMDTMVRRLKHYRDIAVLQRDIKSGRATPEQRERFNQLQSEYYETFLSSRSINEVQSEPDIQANITRNESIDSRLEEIENQELLLPNIPDVQFTIEELQASTDTFENGDFIICRDRKIGTGQMGDTVAGYNKVTNEIFVFKNVKKSEQEFIARVNQYPTGVTDPEDIIRTELDNDFLNTYKVKIAQDDSEYKGYPIANVDLDKYIRTNGKLAPETAVGLVTRITSAVRELHKIGIVHLDLSPTNILLTKDSVKITDFDAASIQTGQDNRYIRGFVGGFSYMIPPELFTDNPTITESADTYEATILLYRLVTGEYPFKHNDGSIEERRQALYEAHLKGEFSIPEDVPESLKAIFRKGITPNVDDRYQTTTELLEDLLNAQESLSPTLLDSYETNTTLESQEEGSLIEPAPTFTAVTEVVPDTEIQEIFENIEFHGQAYQGKELTLELIKDTGLVPKYKIQQNGVNIFFSSQAYDLGHGRAAVLAYVEKDGKFIPRSYYRSNSQGVWRFLPAYDGEWFDKGYNEESVTLPFSVQEPLTNLVNEQGLAHITEPETVFYGTTKPLSEGVSNITYYNEIQRDATKLSGNFYSTNRGVKLPPESLTFTDESDSPDFSAKTSSWNGTSEMYGNVAYDVYPSQNGKYLYMFCRDDRNRAWIGGIEELAETTSTGLKEKWVVGGDLTTPAFEYSTQASGYGNTAIMNLGYVDMFDKYLSKIPVIQEYLNTQR